MNRTFQEYKRSIDIHCATLVLKGRDIEIRELESAEKIELPPEIESGEIKVETMTPEEQKKYEEYKRQRNARVCKEKFKYNPALDTSIQRPKAVIDKEWQREIFEDNLDEIRF